MLSGDRVAHAFGLVNILDLAQHLQDIGPRAATGVQDINPAVREPVAVAKLRAQNLVNSIDHVSHDLSWGIPHALVRTGLRIEFRQEQLVEVLNRFLPHE